MRTKSETTCVFAVTVRSALKCIIGLGLLLGAATSRAQTLSLAQLDHTSWTTRDGAPRSIDLIQQDRDGTLWLASESGLYTFNGINFSAFQSQPGDLQLPSMRIVGLHMTSDGSLLIGFGISGAARIKNHRVVRLYGEDDGLPQGENRGFFESADGSTFTIARNTLFKLSGDRWEPVKAASSIPATEAIRNGFFDRSGTLWVATSRSVWRLASGSRTFERTEQPGDYEEQFKQTLDGSIWIHASNEGNTAGYVRPFLVGKEKRLRSESFPVNASDFLIDSQDYLWIATDHSGLLRAPLFRAPKKGADVRNLPATTPVESFNHVDGLTADIATALFEDNLGDIWVGTMRGLDRFRTPHLRRLLDKRADSTAFLQQCSSGDLWMGSHNEPLLSMHDEVMTVHGRRVVPSFGHCDSNGVMWLSAINGLWRYQGNSSRHIPPPLGVPEIYNREIVGKDDHLLYASYTRHGLWRNVNGVWTKVEVPGLPSATPYSLFMDHVGRLWVGYIDNRVGMLDGSTGHTFAGDTAHPLGIVQVFLESRYGLLIGGSNGIALLVGDHLQAIQAADQLKVQGISGLLQARNGDLWLNGLHGIVRLRAAEVTHAIQSPSYLMRSDGFSDGGIVGPSPQVLLLPSAVEDSHGLFWFATSDVVVSVDPNAIHASTVPPTLSLISARVDNGLLEDTHRIRPGYHTVRITYFGAYITAPDKVRYKYKLNGVDYDFQDVGTRSEAVYTGLQPGIYTFAVMASNGEGAWSRPDESLQFTVEPSFHQTTTFLLLCIGGAFTLLVTAVRMRVRFVAAAVRKSSEARADERIQIARDLHDTLLQGIQGLMLRFHVVAQELPPESGTRASLESALLTAGRIVIEGRDRVSRLRVGDFSSSIYLRRSRPLPVN